jgi:hypothetical protein
MEPRIMYIECKASRLSGPARIGRVSFNKSGGTLSYGGRKFRRCQGYKVNFYDIESHERYWISGCKKRGGDRLYPGLIQIDEDVREEYWTAIRDKPECKDQKVIHCTAKYSV